MTSGAWLHRVEPPFARGTAIKEAIASQASASQTSATSLLTKAPAAGAVS